MASYMLDTNVLIHLRQGRLPETAAKLMKMSGTDMVMSVITYGELRNGAEKSSRREARLATLEAMTEIVAVRDLPAEAAIAYAEIRSRLEHQGEIIGPNDLWIAAHARSANLTLVTSNQREFRRVQGLKVVDWTASGERPA